MGKKPDQIEQDIIQQRNYISRRVEDLQHRVQEDVRTVRAEARGRATGAMDQAKGRMQDARQSVKLDNINLDSIKSLVEEHTVSSMAGALGLGVLLGVVSEGIGGGGSGRSESSRRASAAAHTGGDSRESRNGGGGGISSMIGSMIGPAASTAQSELQDLVREGFNLMKEQLQQVKGGGQSSRSSYPEPPSRVESDTQEQSRPAA